MTLGKINKIFKRTVTSISFVGFIDNMSGNMCTKNGTTAPNFREVNFDTIYSVWS